MTHSRSEDETTTQILGIEKMVTERERLEVDWAAAERDAELNWDAKKSQSDEEFLTELHGDETRLGSAVMGASISPYEYVRLMSLACKGAELNLPLLRPWWADLAQMEEKPAAGKVV